MTVPSDVNKHIYAGNGVTKVWPYTFLLYDASHLQVWVKRGDEESALLERGYVLNEQEKTVTYPPEGTGEAPLSAEDQIIIMRVVPVLQLLDLLNQGEFFAEDIETQFDLIVMMIQQITETLRRAVVGPVDQNDSGVAYQALLDAVEEAKAAMAAARQIAENLSAENKAQIDAAVEEMEGLIETAQSYAEASRECMEASCACAADAAAKVQALEALMQSFEQLYAQMGIEDGGGSASFGTASLIYDGGTSVTYAEITVIRDGKASVASGWSELDPEVLDALNPSGIVDISEVDENGEITIYVDHLPEVEHAGI